MIKKKGGKPLNDKFKQLPTEKQLAIFNASMEVFAKNDYKKASTDDIAAKAGISKGLLFYYFHNKKTLYLETYDYVMQVGRSVIDDPRLFEITDFFELLTYATEKKLQMMTKMPYLYDFALRAFYSEKEEISAPLKQKIGSDITEIYQFYFKNIDCSKFNDGIDPMQILNMLTWMSDGYIHLQQFTGEAVTLESMMEAFSNWVQLLKRASYKEEFQ